jgi:beta-lactamase regulating signal transducer with metallopeptidase domain
MTALLLTYIFPIISVDGHGPLAGWLVALADAAVRALLVAGIVWAGLRLLGMRNVVAQKAAWGLVLAGALLMPFAASWAARSAWLPAEATLVVPAQAWMHTAATALLPRKEVLHSENPMVAAAQGPATQPAHADKAVATPATSSANRFPAPAISNSYFAEGRNQPQPVTPAKEYYLPLSDLAWLVYATVGLALLLRLFYGLGAAVGLWQSAEPIELEPSYLAAGLRLRSSRRVSSPVTVGSGVVLPADYDEWDAEKLRIVLAHERSHVRQGDFYLQALAGLYAALFWFSPLGWWLKRKLSDLGEAISDRAGLEEAVSHASYARILLEFAALPRRTQIGVAMARTGRLSQRIERLLNENSFRQAFGGGRRRFLAVLGIVFAALFSATALIRVEAARILSQPVVVQGPIAGQSHPENATDGGPAIAPAAAKAPLAAVVTHAPVQAPRAASAPPPPEDNADADQDAPETSTSAQCTRSSSYTYSHSSGHSSGTHGYGYAYSSNGESYAFVSGNERHVRFSGDLHTGEIDKARSVAHGDFLWFSRNGKSYVVDDLQTIARIQAMYKPMEDLGRQQEELGKRQEVLGRQQEELGRKQELATVPTPDIAREMAELNAAAASLQATKTTTITADQLADLQNKIGDLQGKLGELQGEVGRKQGELGREQGRLGEQQGRLGTEQGRLGAEQGRLARDADVKIKSLIDESLKQGKAKPVQ